MMCGTEEQIKCFGCGSELEAEQAKDFNLEVGTVVKVCEACYRKNKAGRIDERFDYGRHIYLVCTKCGALFHTKNIAPLGCRTLFFDMNNMQAGMQCDAMGHKMEDLRLRTNEELSDR